MLITNQNLPKTLILYLENNDDNKELTYSYINKPEIKLFDYSYNSIDNKPTGLSQIKIDSFQIDNQKNSHKYIIIYSNKFQKENKQLLIFLIITLI